MVNCIICGSTGFIIKAPDRCDLYFDCSCSYCGEFRLNDLANQRISSASFTKIDKVKLSSFLHSKKMLGIKIVIISEYENAYNGDFVEEIRDGVVLDLFLDDILMLCKLEG